MALNYTEKSTLAKVRFVSADSTGWITGTAEVGPDREIFGVGLVMFIGGSGPGWLG